MSQTEVVDPIVLAAKVVEHEDCCNCCCCGEIDVSSVPEDVCKVFDDSFVDSSEGRSLYVTIGIFTIVRLLREVELIVPVIDYCIPCNECIDTTDNSPCEFFDRLRFPVDEFFPPEKEHFDNLEPSRDDCCCK